MAKRLKIAIDLDGTAYRFPELFSEIMRGLQRAGHSVGILTGHSEKDAKFSDLRKLKSLGFPDPDFYHGSQDGDVDPHVWKPKKVKKYKIDYLFDDFKSPTVILFPNPKSADDEGDEEPEAKGT